MTRISTPRTENLASRNISTKSLEARAAKGDVEAVWQVLTTSAADLFNREQVFRLLLQAVEVSSRKAPADFAGYVFAKMQALVAYMMLRSHLLCHRAFRGHDRHVRGRAILFPPHDVNKELLPDLLELQRHAAEIAEAQARVARVWRLVKGPDAKRVRRPRRTAAAKASRAPKSSGRVRPHAHPVPGFSDKFSDIIVQGGRVAMEDQHGGCS